MLKPPSSYAEAPLFLPGPKRCSCHVPYPHDKYAPNKRLNQGFCRFCVSFLAFGIVPNRIFTAAQIIFKPGGEHARLLENQLLAHTLEQIRLREVKLLRACQCKAKINVAPSLMHCRVTTEPTSRPPEGAFNLTESEQCLAHAEQIAVRAGHDSTGIDGLGAVHG